MSSLDPCGFDFEACLSIQGKTESLGTAEQWEKQNSSVFISLCIRELRHRAMNMRKQEQAVVVPGSRVPCNSSPAGPRFACRAIRHGT